MSVFNKINHYLEGEITIPRGVWGLSDIKLYLAILSYFASLVFFINDQWFGKAQFDYKLSIVVIFLSLIILASLCWEDYLLGPPQGINLFLHFCLLAPFSLFLSRIIGESPAKVEIPSIVNFIGKIVGLVADFSGLTQVVPSWVMEYFYNPSLLLISLFVFLGLCFKNKTIRLSFVLLIILYLFVANVSNSKWNWSFPMGCLCLWTGICLQFCPYEKILKYKKILNKLSVVNDRSEYITSLKICLEAFDSGKVSEDTAVKIIKRAYCEGKVLSEEHAKLYTGEVVSRLISEHGIVYLKGDLTGKYLVPNDNIIYEDNNYLYGVAIIPRMVFVGVMAIIWIISPIDLIPDNIPFIGTVDDSIIGMIALVQMYKGKKSLDELRKKN